MLHRKLLTYNKLGTPRKKLRDMQDVNKFLEYTDKMIVTDISDIEFLDGIKFIT